MNVVHRCRFTEWEPSTVLSITIATSGTKFALLRTNGNIEIWTQVIQDTPDSVLTVHENGKRYELSQYLSRFAQSATQNAQQQSGDNIVELAQPGEHPYRYGAMHYLSSQWVCTATIPGSGKNVISQVLWTHVDPIANPLYYGNNNNGNSATIIDRLFTVGTNGRIVEWDLFTSLPKHSAQCHGGAIHCAAISPSGCQMAAGCHDGTVRVFDISNIDNEPLLTRTMGKHKRQIFCIDWLHYAHIAPPPQPNNLMQQQHRPGTVAAQHANRVDSSSWWDPPLIATGGIDGTLRVWNAATGLCTLKTKSDAIRFNVAKARVKHTQAGKEKLAKLSLTQNGKHKKNIDLRHIKITGVVQSEAKKAKQQKQALIQAQRDLENAGKGKKNNNNNKKKLNFGNTKSAGGSESDEDGDDMHDDFDDMFGDEDEDDDAKYGFTDSDEDEESAADSDGEDVGFIPTGKGKGDDAVDITNMDKKKRKIVLRRGGRVKAVNHIIKLKWVDVETIVCLDKTSNVLIINAKTGTINNRISASATVNVPTDLAVIPATLHTRSLAHKHNIAYNTKFNYQVHPSNIELGQEGKLLNSLFSPVLNTNTTATNAQQQQIVPIQYIPALKTKQVYVPNPIIYISGANGKVQELTGTRSIEFNAIHQTDDDAAAATQTQHFLPQVYAHQAKFVSTGLHGAHTHDILSLTLSTVNVYGTPQVMLFSTGADTVVSSYAVHPYNIRDSATVKTYFQYLRPIRVSQLSSPPEISMSNYTSPWSHHWNIARHQEALKRPEIQRLIDERIKQVAAKRSVGNVNLLQSIMTKTHYPMKFVAGDLQRIPFCTCNQCKVTNIATVVNSNLVLRTLHALHLYKSANDTTYTTPQYYFNEEQLAQQHTQSSLISYIPMNDLTVQFKNVQHKDNFYTTANIHAARLLKLLKRSPTLQYTQRQAPEQPVIACPRGFGVDLYTIANHDVLFVKDSKIYDNSTNLQCMTNDFNNVLCDLQLHNGTIPLDRNAIVSTLLSMYSIRQKNHQHYFDRNATQNHNKAIVDALMNPKQQFTDATHQMLTQAQRLEQEIVQQHCNPHLFTDFGKLSAWQIIDPSFALQQYNTHTFSSQTPTIEGTVTADDDEKKNGNNNTKDNEQITHVTTQENTNGIKDYTFNCTGDNQKQMQQNLGKVQPFTSQAKLPAEANLPNHVLSLRLSLSAVSVVTSTQMSPNGALLLISDATSIKLFGLQRPNINKKNPALTQIQKYAIDAKKLQFPPQLPTFAQYLRSALYKQKFTNNSNNMDDEEQEEEDDDLDESDMMASIPEDLCESYIEEYHYISLFTRLLSDNGCQTAAFSPCSSLLAISLTPFASTRVDDNSSGDMYDVSSSLAVANNYPYLGTIILIDLVTYCIIGYIQREQIKFFSHSFGVHLPQSVHTKANQQQQQQNNNNGDISSSLSDELKEMYKEQYIAALDKNVDVVTVYNTSPSASQNALLTSENANLLTLTEDKKLNTLVHKKTESKKMADSSSDSDSDSDDSDSDSSSDSDSDSDDEEEQESDDIIKRLMNKTKQQFEIDRQVFDIKKKTSTNNTAHNQITDLDVADKDDDNKPTANDLVTTIQFSKCGRYITSLDKNNKIRVYQLLDRFFTPSLYYLQTISPSLSSSTTSTNNQHISSYTVLPTVQDLKQNHLANAALTSITFDDDKDKKDNSKKNNKTNSNIDEEKMIVVNNQGNDVLINNINVKATLQPFVGPSRVDRAVKMLDRLYFTYKVFKKEYTNIMNNKTSPQVARIMANLWKVVNMLVLDSNIPRMSAQQVELANGNNNNGNNNMDDDFDDDDDLLENNNNIDDNQQETIPNILDLLYGIKTTKQYIEEHQQQQQQHRNNFRNDRDNDKLRNNNLTTLKKPKRDAKGFNPQHLLSELIQLLLSNHQTVKIPAIFFDKTGAASQASKYRPSNATETTAATTTTSANSKKSAFGKKGAAAKATPAAVTTTTTTTKKDEKKDELEYVEYKPFTLVDFDYDISPSISGGYTNGHYFVYDTNNKSYLCYDSTRPQDVYSPVSIDATKQNNNNNNNNNQDDTIVQNNNNLKSRDPLMQPKSTSYYSQVIPYRDALAFNEAHGGRSGGVPLLFHNDVQKVYNTSHNNVLRPLLSVCTGDVPSPMDNTKEVIGVGGLLSSFNLLFITTEDCYSLQLPLHRCYPSTFSRIISETYKQMLYILNILQQCNQTLYSTVHTMYKEFCLDYIDTKKQTTTSNTTTSSSASTPAASTASKSSLFGGAAQKRAAPTPAPKPAAITITPSTDTNNDAAALIQKYLTVYNAVAKQTTNPLKPFDKTTNQPFIFTTADPSDIKKINVYTTTFLDSINHNERISLLMSECLSLLPIQRLKALGKFRPVLYFNFLHQQPTTQIGAMKSLFFFVNNFMLTYFNQQQLQAVYKTTQLAKLQANPQSKENDKLIDEMKKDKVYYLTAQDDATKQQQQQKNNPTNNDNDTDEDGYSDDEPTVDQYDINMFQVRGSNSNNNNNKQNKKDNTTNPVDAAITKFNLAVKPTNINDVTLNNACVVVEVPWINIINKLPARAYKQKWGQM